MNLKVIKNNAWGTVGGGTTINNNADNRIITGSGTADTLEAETTFTFNSGTLGLSTGDLTVDVAGDIIFDADGGDITFKDAGTEIGHLSNSASDFIISSAVNDKDLKFQGVDNNSVITALTLDM